MGRCSLGGLLMSVAMLLSGGGFVPSTPSDAGPEVGGMGVDKVAARHGPAQILSRRHGTAVSFNWAGNAASGTTFTDVKGTWTLPAVTCSKNQPQIASFWVGIDGFTSNTVEQIGTDADCVHGQALYFAWWEMFPAGLNVIPLNVNPGDMVSAEVSSSGTAFTLNITVGTQQFSTTQTSAAAAKSSAEWIAEGPSQFLADFTAVSFFDASATGEASMGPHTGSITDSAWTKDQIVMVTRSNKIRAQPCCLLNDGTGFMVDWLHR